MIPIKLTKTLSSFHKLKFKRSTNKISFIPKSKKITSHLPIRTLYQRSKVLNDKENIDDSVHTMDPKDTIFAKIVNKEIPVNFIYEDDVCVAFHDINPVAPVHALVLPKKPFATVSDDFKDSETLGHCLIAARKVAETLGLKENGFRLVINHGKHGLQSIRWLHIHIIGGKKLSWPPGV